MRRAERIIGEFAAPPHGSELPQWPGWRIYYGRQRIYLSRTPMENPLVHFRAFAANGTVTVSWRTAFEIESEGFDLFRNVDTNWVQVNSTRIPPQNPLGAVYFCTDPECPIGDTVTYRLVEYCSGGTEV
ncbi:MAG: hypothetical protein ACUVWX_11635 [Kiritimatiellia bacterium]